MATISTVPFLLPNQAISLLQKCKTMSELRQIHAYIIKTNLVNHTIVMSKFISFCSLSGVSGGLDCAIAALPRISLPNPFIYFALTKGLSNSSNPLESVVLYTQMLVCLDELDGFEFSLPSVLKACAKLGAFEEGQQLHGHIVKTQFHLDPLVLNSLIRMYLELGKIEMARQLFDKMPQTDIVSWNSMISGYLKVGQIDAASLLFNMMPKRDVVSYNSMIDGYGKYGKFELAQDLFDKMTTKDVITWTSMISACVRNNHLKGALHFFRKMLRSRVQLDAPAIVSVLSAIAELGFVEEGKWIHTYLSTNKLGFDNSFLGSALVDMYAKCGYIDDAYHIFETISHRRKIGDWNSMISGLAIHGLGKEALSLFYDLEKMKIEPDDVSFIGLLSACSHGGLVDEGEFCFKTMQEQYRIVPKLQHYGCMVDLYSRAGHINDALRVLKDMPFEADILSWKAILSASMKHGNVEMGEIAATRALELAPNDSSCYILLSNIYAKAKRWDDVAKIRLLMRERGVRKTPGCSSILVDGYVHEFLVGKEVKANYNGMVLTKIEEIVSRLKSEGYQPELNQVLLDVEEEEKEGLISLHTEKMALGFGLIHVRRCVPIRIVNNMRVCCDCHSFLKLVSKVYDHQIILRDQNRFHCFKSGSCSCNEYW